jgi:hypothetical protein
MQFSGEMFHAVSEKERRDVLDYFLNREYPKPFPLEAFSNSGEWRLGDIENSIGNSERLLDEKFMENSGEVFSFKWKDPDNWRNGFSATANFHTRRGIMLGDVVLAWLQTGEKKYLDLFADFYETFDASAPLVKTPLKLDSGDAAFYGGPDPNLPWFTESWGFFHDPMDTGFRLSRFCRIWSSGIFKHLPVETGFKFLKSLYEHLMAYKSFIDFPYVQGNHYLLELGVAPYIAACFFPELPECRRIKETAKETINNSFAMAILEDGSFQEHSAGYDLVTFNDILFPLCLARHNGEDLLSENNFKIFRKTVRFICDLFHPNGEMVQFGDSSPISIDSIKDDLEQLEHMPETTALPVFYPEGGYAFLGCGDSRIAITAVNKHFDKAHIHWEHLSFELYSDGVVWIGDPSSVIRQRSKFTRPLIYSGKKAERSPARQFHYSLAAHNCVLIDSMNPGDEPYSDHEFGGRPPKCFDFEFSRDPQTFSASHDLFSCLGISHRRKFSLLSEAFLIEDFFEGHPDKRKHIYKTILHPMSDVNIEFDEELLYMSKNEKYLTVYFSNSVFQTFPNVHLREYAYSDYEANSSFLCAEWSACGNCSSLIIIAPGKVSKNVMRHLLF